MTALLEVGPDPGDLKVTIVKGGSWWARFINTVSEVDDTPQDFLPGDVIELAFGDILWTATITTSQAVWDKNEAAVSALVTALENVKDPQAILWYRTDGRRIPWAIGTVQIRG